MPKIKPQPDKKQAMDKYKGEVHNYSAARPKRQVRSRYSK